jgi:MFS family permease
MQKIPVGQTIASAYQFLFARIGTIIGIAWLPAVLSSAVSYMIHTYAAMHRAELEAGDPQATGAYVVVSLLGLLVTIFMASVVAVAITRQVLGQGSSGVVLYFAAGRSEWRMLAANIRYLLAIFVLVAFAFLITILAFLLSGVPLDAPERIQPNAATILAGLISWFVFLYAFATLLRVGFLLPPTVVSEEKGGLRRSHELTKGNFWRALAVILALGLPLLLLVVGGEVAVLRAALGPEFARMNPTEFFQRAGQAMEAKLLPWTIFTTVIFILGSGLIYSGAAFAYRAAAGNGRPSSPPPRG